MTLSAARINYNESVPPSKPRNGLIFLMTTSAKILSSLSLLAVLCLVSDPAHAFRCKSKIVKDGMHEQQVVAICGQPTTARNIGVAVRGVDVGYRSRYPGGWTSNRTYPGVGLAQEVFITEYVYNFGPRKLMRRLLFEGGVLVSIETIGYGYIEKK